MNRHSMEHLESTLASPSSPEKELLGVSSWDDIHRQFLSIDAAFQIGERIKHTWQETPISIPSAVSLQITTELCTQFEREFSDDVLDFHLRVQRLKIRILGHLLAGTWRDLKPDLAYDESEKTPGGKAHSLAGKYKRGEENFDAAGRKELVGTFNALLPSEYQLLPLENLAAYDATQMKEFSAELRYGKASDEKQVVMLRSQLAEITELERVILTIQNQGELFNKTPQGVSLHEKKFADLWEVYRQLLKQIAGYEELGSWVSPTYGTSGKGQKGEK